MPIIEEAIAKFHSELPEEIQLTSEMPEILNPLNALGTSYGVDLSSLLVFLVVGDLTLEQVPQFAKDEFGFDGATAKKFVQTFEETVFKPLLERIEFLNEHPDKTMTLEQEKVVVENIFKKSILAEFERNPILIEAVNRRLFFILARDLEFQKRLEQLLYENNEVVTEQNILIDGIEQKGTIANWIKDFIAHYGSQSYDSVSLSAFLINSDNGKKLSEEDRKKVARVLRLYANVKFFPESMPSDEPEDWQIIPFEDLNAAPETVVEKPLPKTTKEPVVQSVDKPGPSSPELLELKNMLLQYPVGSLERAAIEEEIKTLEK